MRDEAWKRDVMARRRNVPKNATDCLVAHLLASGRTTQSVAGSLRLGKGIVGEISLRLWGYIRYREDQRQALLEYPRNFSEAIDYERRPSAK